MRVSIAEDWRELADYYEGLRRRHPLQSESWWNWRRELGAFAYVRNEYKVVGHLGVCFAGGYGWITNIYRDIAFGGGGILRHMYDACDAAARDHYGDSYNGLASVGVNAAAVGMYAKMRWTRHPDLVRLGRLATGLQQHDGPMGDEERHFARQPGPVEWIRGRRVTGPFVETVMAPWDPDCPTLIERGWQVDPLLPWFRNPLDISRKPHFEVLTQRPERPARVTYWCADHCRVGSI